MDRLRKIYVDQPKWVTDIVSDDFLVAIGKRQSNSVYHVFESKKKESPKSDKMNRFHLRVYKSSLIEALSREPSQGLFQMSWYSRNKKNG